MTFKSAPSTAWFFNWRRPQDFNEGVEAWRASLPTPFDELIHTQMNELLEAISAGQFAARLEHERGGPIEVRLGDPKANMPDFMIHVRGRVFCFETTEIDRENRKRGKEYQELQTKIVAGSTGLTTHMTEADEQLEHEEFVVQLPRRIKSKLDKIQKRTGSYRGENGCELKLSDINLLARVNLSHRLTDDDCGELVACSGSKFQSIWLLKPTGGIVQICPIDPVID